jgi:hypothetical protein
VLQGEATDGVQVGEYANQSLEAIVEEVQGVEMPQRNHRAEVVSQAVEKYIKEIKSPGGHQEDVEAGGAGIPRGDRAHTPPTRGSTLC